MNKPVRRWAGLSVIGLWLIGAVNGVYAQDACLDARVTASDGGGFRSSATPLPCSATSP